MGVFRALLLAETNTGNTGNTVQAPDANAWRNELFNVLTIIFAFVAAVVVIWAIYLGFKLASAADEGSRGQAKSRFFKAISAVVIIAVLFAMSMAIKFVWLPPINPNENPDENKEETPPEDQPTPPIPEGKGILDVVNYRSKAKKQIGDISCKSTAIAILLNIMFDTNTYSFGTQAGSSTQLNMVSSKPAVDGKTYRGNYQSDDLSGTTLSALKSAINTSVVQNRVPIIVMVKPSSGGQHWVVCVEVNAGSYLVLNPGSGGVQSIPESQLGVRAGEGSKALPYDRYGYCSVS